MSRLLWVPFILWGLHSICTYALSIPSPTPLDRNTLHSGILTVTGFCTLSWACWCSVSKHSWGMWVWCVQLWGCANHNIGMEGSSNGPPQPDGILTPRWWCWGFGRRCTAANTLGDTQTWVFAIGSSAIRHFVHHGYGNGPKWYSSILITHSWLRKPTLHCRRS